METPYSPLDRRTIAFNTSMARRHAEEAVQAVKDYEADSEKTERLTAGECKRCWYLWRGRVAGQAMTTWYCGVCGVEDMWGNTGTPKVCKACSTEHTICRECGGDLHMRANRRKFPTPKPKEEVQQKAFTLAKLGEPMSTYFNDDEE